MAARKTHTCNLDELTEDSLLTGEICGEFLEAGDGTRVDVGDEHTGDRQGELPRLIDGLKTTTGLPLQGDREAGEVVGEGINLMQWGVGVGALGGDVSSRIAWLRTSTFDFEFIYTESKT